MYYLNKTGLQYLWGKILALIPTDDSELTNGAGYITATQASTLITSIIENLNGDNLGYGLADSNISGVGQAGYLVVTDSATVDQADLGTVDSMVLTR